MNTFLLLLLLSISPLRWDGAIWNDLSLESKLAYIAGFESGLATAAYLLDAPEIMIPDSISPEFIMLDLNLFYLNPALTDVLIPDAILIRGGNPK